MFLDKVHSIYFYAVVVLKTRIKKVCIGMRNSMKPKYIILIFIISGLISACGGSGNQAPATTESSESSVALAPTETPDSAIDSVTENEADEEQAESPLDAPVSPLNSPNSPLSAPTPTPVPTPVPIVPFGLNGPLYDGLEKVSGFGPPNLPILIVDISGGENEILAIASTDQDGNYSTELNRPLKAGFRIGVTIGNLDDSELTYDDFKDRGFYGPDAMVFPQLGFFYDTKMTLEEK